MCSLHRSFFAIALVLCALPGCSNSKSSTSSSSSPSNDSCTSCTPAEGDSCTAPGTIWCGDAPIDGSPVPVLYCGTPPIANGTGGAGGATAGQAGHGGTAGAAGGVATAAGGAAMTSQGPMYTQVFTCPMTQQCADIDGNTSIACGEMGFSSTYAIPGAPCAEEHAAACTIDQTKALLCMTGMWTVTRACKKGCGYQGPGYVSSDGSTCTSGGCQGCL